MPRNAKATAAVVDPPKNQVTVMMPTDDKQSAANAVLTAAQGMKVTTAAEFEAAAAFVQGLKANSDALDAERISWKKPLDDLAKKVQSLFKPAIDVYEQAERIVKRSMAAYLDDQERLRQIAQRKVDEAAEKERQRLAALAQKAEDSGRTSKAIEYEERASQVIAPVLSRAAPKVSGITQSKVWKFEITDPKQINPAFMMPDQTKIRQQVQALKGDAAALIGPGVRVWSDTAIAAGSAA